MRSTSRTREKVKIQPPMTPMIDIIFQLLIFFLLTPTFQSHEGYLTTNLPRDQGPNPRPPLENMERIKIELLDEGNEGEGVSIILNDTQSLGDNFKGLRSALEGYRARPSAESPRPHLADDGGATQVRRAGVRRGGDGTVHEHPFRRAAIVRRRNILRQVQK